MNQRIGQIATAIPVTGDEEDARWQSLFDTIGEHAAGRERERVLPFEQVALLKAARFGALLFRGPGEGRFRHLYRLVIRLAAADANVAHIFRNHFTVAEQYVRRPAGGRNAAWRQAVMEGAIFGLANTELGSSPVGRDLPTTRLSADGDGYRLSGTKYYSTGTLYADHVLVRATTPDEVAASVIIPTTRAGVETVDDWDGAGQRLTASGTTHFHAVRVEPDEVVADRDDVGYGMAYANTQAQLFLTAVNAGIARAILDDGRHLLQKRVRTFYYAATNQAQEDPLLQQVLGRISANAFAAEAAILAAADRLDAASDAREAGRNADALSHEAALAASQAKLVADELAIASGSMLFELGGASATKRSHNLDRHWRNARTLASHNPGTAKAAAIGAYEALGTLLPSKGFF
jgi:alkylation response protein AidB-like acyl-CoA dehydrogenase